MFPDSNAQFQGENPQPLYTVKFEARALWGDAASSRDTVCLDLWNLETAKRPDGVATFASAEGLARDADGPVFAEPWQVQAFALLPRTSARLSFGRSAKPAREGRMRDQFGRALPRLGLVVRERTVAKYLRQ